MKIREFKEKDLKVVQDLVYSVLNDELNIQNDVYHDEDLEDIAKTYRAPKEIFLVGTDKDQIIGTIGIKKDDAKVALLRRMFVDKNYRQHGLGRRLLKKAITFAKESGYEKMALRCTNKMVAAINLAIKNGFIEKDIIDMKDYKIFLLEKKL